MIVIDLGFTNEYFFSDQFHLIDSGLVNIFGKYGVNLLQGILVNMIQAQSEEEFYQNYNAGVEFLNATCADNCDLISKFKAFEEDNKIYASYCFAKVPSKSGRHGSGTCEKIILVLLIS